MWIWTVSKLDETNNNNDSIASNNKKEKKKIRERTVLDALFYTRKANFVRGKTMNVLSEVLLREFHSIPEHFFCLHCSSLNLISWFATQKKGSEGEEKLFEWIEMTYGQFVISV